MTTTTGFCSTSTSIQDLAGVADTLDESIGNTMHSKHQELELRTVLEGLEELSTFMSFQSDCGGLRILSVETVEEAAQRELAEQSENVVSLQGKRPAVGMPDTISKSLQFQDRLLHS
jgi:hypothetical protein